MAPKAASKRKAASDSKKPAKAAKVAKKDDKPAAVVDDNTFVIEHWCVHGVHLNVFLKPPYSKS